MLRKSRNNIRVNAINDNLSITDRVELFWWISHYGVCIGGQVNAKRQLR